MCDQSMKFKLIKIFYLLYTWWFSFDNRLSGWITFNETFVYRIQNRTFQLMIKIQCCLSFMFPGIVIKQFLIRCTGKFCHLQVRSKFFYPFQRHQIFCHCRFSDRTSFVYFYPLMIILVKQLFFVYIILHRLFLSRNHLR